LISTDKGDYNTKGHCDTRGEMSSSQKPLFVERKIISSTTFVLKN